MGWSDVSVGADFILWPYKPFSHYTPRLDKYENYINPKLSGKSNPRSKRHIAAFIIGIRLHLPKHIRK